MHENFRTQFNIEKPKFSVSYDTKILSIGSCFAVEIAGRFLKQKFNIQINPFGITYNPFSIVNGLMRLLNEASYSDSELFFQNELWNSFDHHSDFSNPDKGKTLEAINQHFAAASAFLKEADVLIITLGSAFYYELKSTGTIVNNCHKLPDKMFEQKLDSVSEIVKSVANVFQKLLDKNPKLKIILSVSPVRYMKYGAVENQLSKSNLIVACHELKKQFDGVYYFPAYELMMDDLRDYRFYAEDMIHPNNQAVEYIAQKFQNAVVDPACFETMKKIDAIQNALAHRPRNANSSEHKKFLEKILVEIATIEKQNPNVNFSEERKMIEAQL
jgi:hypothetical protein